MTEEKTRPAFFETTIEVRGYELDSYGHVNHAIYVSYLEHARWKMLEQEGIGLEHFKKWSRWPVIAGLEIQYQKPAFLGDRLDVRTEVVEVGRTSFTFSQTIHRAGQPVVQAKVRAVMINEHGRPASMPDEMKSRWGGDPA